MYTMEASLFTADMPACMYTRAVSQLSDYQASATSFQMLCFQSIACQIPICGGEMKA